MVEKSIIKEPRNRLKKLRYTHAEAIAFTVFTIAKSPLVAEYIIGYTSRQGLIRKEAYKAIDYEHLVILADRLSLDDAHRLEEALQGYINDCKNMVIYKKYDAARRGKRYYPSAGQKRVAADSPIHSIYMAWSEP